MSCSGSGNLESIEEALSGLPEIELKGLFRRSSNYTFLVEVSGPAERRLAVYKPAQGETPLWDFAPSTLFRREVAAYRLAKQLGWPDIPPTVIRSEAPHGVGALQMYVDADPGLSYLRPPAGAAPDWLPVALFDFLTNNADRKAGHCLFDPAGKLWVIDHGLTFHVAPKLRTVIWDHAGEPVPAPLREDLCRAAESLAGGSLAAELDQLLSRAEVRTLGRRLRSAAQPGFLLPEPTSDWSIPWPPV
ncbi:MAG: hypothetical protein M3072_09615 [Candidatus Dormibacteraeota bacterium]|nr:hypothetical protein [Candidatus Dormibacteraeota bacterium]